MGPQRPAAVQLSLAQSAAEVQLVPFAQGPQAPPQSTPASAPLATPSPQLGSAQQPSRQTRDEQSASRAQLSSGQVGPASGGGGSTIGAGQSLPLHPPAPPLPAATHEPPEHSGGGGGPAPPPPLGDATWPVMTS